MAISLFSKMKDMYTTATAAPAATTSGSVNPLATNNQSSASNPLYTGNTAVVNSVKAQQEAAQQAAAQQAAAQQAAAQAMAKQEADKWVTQPSGQLVSQQEATAQVKAQQAQTDALWAQIAAQQKAAEEKAAQQKAAEDYYNNLYADQMKRMEEAMKGINNYWQLAGSDLGAGTKQVINDMISGDAMNAAAIRARESVARAEANNRALTASQIHESGLAGTAIGAYAANAPEAAMMQNRFANNLDIDVQRQGLRLQGAGAAQDYANNVNRFALDSDANLRAWDENLRAWNADSRAWDENSRAWNADSRADAEAGRAADVHSWNTSNRAQSKFADAMLANPDWANMSAEELAADKEFMNYAQTYWDSMFGPMAGAVNMDWAMERVAAVNNPELRNPYVLEQKQWNDFVDSYQFPKDTPPETINALKNIPLIALGKIMDYEITFDENDIPQIRELEEKEKEARVKETVADIESGQMPIAEYGFTGGYGDPVYKALLESSGIPDGVGQQEHQGARKGTVVQGLGIGREANPGHTQYPDLEAARKAGTPVKIDSKLYYVKDITTIDGAHNYGNSYMTGYTTYELVDVVTKNSITKSTSSQIWNA